jgi:hypothetical protein
MPKLGPKLGRRAGPVGTALLMWDLWRRIPPKQRRLLIQQARKHGPRLAMQVYEAGRRSGRAR